MAYVYALLLKNGVIKIGATTDPWGRVPSITFACGQPPVEMAYAELPEGADMYDEESRLLAIATDIARPARGREYFRGMSFATAMSVISKAPFTAFVTRRFESSDRGISLDHPERHAWVDGPICPVPESWRTAAKPTEQAEAKAGA